MSRQSPGAACETASPLLNVDIVVPSASDMSLVRRSLPRLAAARQRGRLEGRAILVDDHHNRDGLAAVAAAAGMEVIRGAKAGPGAARNTGAAAGRSRWILFCDDDVVIDVDALSAHTQSETAIDDAAVLGRLRPPEDAPAWIRWSYEDGVFTGGGHPTDTATSPPSFSSALVLVRRDAFEAVGGFPEYPNWGWEDAVFGVRTAAIGGMTRVPIASWLSGMHLPYPSWEDWLERQRRAGTALAGLRGTITEEEHLLLRAACGIEGTGSAAVKRSLALCPRSVWRYARTRPLRKAAAAAAFMRGYRERVAEN